MCVYLCVCVCVVECLKEIVFLPEWILKQIKINYGELSIGYHSYGSQT